MVREVRSLNRSERALSTSQFFRRTSSVHIGHVPKLRELFVALERASAAREQSIYSVSRSLEQAADRRRTLTIDQEIILNEIQGLPGFERFLVQKEFHELGAATHLRPVVLLNAVEIDPIGWKTQNPSCREESWTRQRW